MDLSFLDTIVPLTTPSAAVLSVCIGNGGCGQPILMKGLRSVTIFCAVVKRAPNLASAADVITNLMIRTMVLLYQKNSSPWTYASTSYVVEKPRSNSNSTGTRDSTIRVTTAPNTTRRSIISHIGHFSRGLRSHYTEYANHTDPKDPINL